MAYASPFLWTSAALSHVGLVREINEDACIERPQRGLWAVADGMGGHDAGDFASRTVVAALDGVGPGGDLTSRLAEARDRLQAANRQLRVEAAIRNVRLIGSTVVALIACERYCAYLWAGDSRIYLYRQGNLRQLSRDHSQLEEMRARGYPVDGMAHPGHNLITRAVGALDLLELDEGLLPVDGEDIFLLCSDGLSNHASEQDIATVLADADCRRAAQALVDLALAGGGRDNISVVVVHAEDLDSGDKTILNPAL